MTATGCRCATAGGNTSPPRSSCSRQRASARPEAEADWRAHQRERYARPTNDEAMMTTRARWTPLDELTLRAGFRTACPWPPSRGSWAARRRRCARSANGWGCGRATGTPCRRPPSRTCMGVGCPKTVTSWVGRGWLRPIGGRRARPWRFAATALWDLVALPEAVVAITAGAASPMRSCAPTPSSSGRTHPRWLRLTEVARALSRHGGHRGRLGGARTLCGRASAALRRALGARGCAGMALLRRASSAGYGRRAAGDACRLATARRHRRC